MPSAKLQKKNKSITPSAKLQKKNQSRRPSSKVQPDHAAVILSQDRGQPDAIVVSQNKDKPEDLLDNLSKAEPDTLVVSQSRSQPAHAPDGGWRAWLQVLGSFIIFCITWGLLLSFGAFQSYYQLVLLEDYSASTISWIGTVQSFLILFIGIFAGPLFDMGYLRTLLFLGGFLTVLGMISLSFATQYYQVFLAQGVCLGLGGGAMYIPSLALVAASFTTKRQIAIALVSSGTSIGAIIFNMTFQRSITPLGYAWTTRIMGFVALGGFAVAIPMVLCRTVHVSGKRRSFLDLGAYAEPPFLMLCIGGFFRFLGYFTPVFFIPVFAQTALGLSETISLYLLVTFNASSFIGRLLGSLVASRITFMLPWIVCSVAAGALCLAWLAVHSLGGFIAFAILYGMVSGPLTAFPPAAVPLLCPSPKLIGTRMGMLWGSTAFAFLLGTPIAAAISDTSNGHFFGLQIFCGATLLVGALLLLPLWRPIRKRQRQITSASSAP